MHVPEQVVTNRDLEALMDTSDEWIQQRSGIKERRFAKAGVGPSDLAFEAAGKALEAARVKPTELDMIVFATLSPDYYFPGSGVFLQDRLKAGPIPALDVRNQCSGFLYGLSVAQQFIATGTYERILVVGAEVHSKALNLSTPGRDVSVLFGDGAGAVVVEAAPSDGKRPRGILAMKLHSDGAHRDALKIEYPSTRHEPFITHEVLDKGGHWTKMDGKYVFKHAVTMMPEVVTAALSSAGYKPDDVDLYLFHQANLRINEAVMKHMGQPASKAVNNIDRYGNCSAASIPMLLDECVRSGRLDEGQLVCMGAFGAGFTWGSAVIRW
jgi:3-oxoacyl-[acyl-carrier-protein] synthase-3